MQREKAPIYFRKWLTSQIVLVFAILSFNSLLSRVCWGHYSPDIEWETVRTPHFRIHYPITYGRFTAFFSNYLEEAYAVLSKDLKWELSSPAEIVVRGDTDISNGSSSVFPFNLMQVNAVPFTANQSIGEYDHWIRTLAYHELTHIIANDTVNGLFSLGSIVFGSVAKMNSYQPIWLVEGLAVYEETMHSNYGRGRSAYVDMVLRTAAESELLDGANPLLGVTLDRLNDGPPFWPGASTPYFYGYLLNEMMVEVGGPTVPGDLSYESGGRVPYFVDGALENIIRMNYTQLWKLALGKLRATVAADLAIIRATAVTEIRRLTDTGRLSSSPAVSSDGSKIYFVRDSYSTGPGISLYDREKKKTEDVMEWRFGGPPGLKRCGDFLLYARYEPYDEYMQYSDVFAWDLSRERETRLTEGARGSEPDCSPDFKMERGKVTSGKLTYVKNLPDANQALVIWEAGAEKIIFQGKNFERIASPAWGRASAADWIVFSFKVNGANERLVAVNARTGETHELTSHPTLVASSESHVNEVTPAWVMSGDVPHLIFSSSISGVYNVYELDWYVGAAKNKPRRLTNVETGLFYPVDSGRSGELIAMAYGPNGMNVAEFATGPQPPSSVLKSVHDKLHEKSLSPPVLSESAVADTDAPDPQEDHPEGKPENYNPFPALWPKYWVPFIQEVAGGWVAGIETSGFDALQQHSYSGFLAWDTRATFPLYDFHYQYDGLYPSVQFDRLQSNEYIGIFNQSNLVDTTQLNAIYPIGFWSVGFGGKWVQSEFNSQTASNAGLQFRLSHSDMETYADSIDSSGGERGHRASIGVTGYVIGQEQFTAFEARIDERLPFLFDQSFLRFFATGAHANNQNLTSLYYVGGGETTISEYQSFLVRGYPAGAIYGRNLATFNLEWWFPLKDLFRGQGTFPVFYERAKFKLFVDTGSGEFVTGQPDNFVHWPIGVGAHLLQDVELGYRFPFSLGVGVDWGLDSSLGGGPQLVLGVSTRI